MLQYGTATVAGADGTVAYDAEAALAAFTDSIESEQRVTVEELMDGFGELLGFRKSDERVYLTGSGSLQKTLVSLKFPPVPSKVTFTPNANLDLSSAIAGAGGQAPAAKGELYGDPALSPKANEYIYVGGARRTMVRGQGALQLTCFRPKSSDLTVAQLLTVAT